ncbi:MAG: hypothetical protein D6732_29425 [Methanobacteriota archaeon]|nr:MAG: hypothetical protein D6732_29425 [Euryarchaeota archaeon]
MRRYKLLGIVVGVSLLFAGLSFSAFAAPASIINHGKDPVFVRIKDANGSYSFTMVPSGKEVQLPKNTSRIRVNTLSGDLNVKLKRPDGKELKIGKKQNGKSILVDKPITGKVWINTGYDQPGSYLPDATVNEFKPQLGKNYTGQPVGIGLSPSPSNGPIYNPASPVSLPKDFTRYTWQQVKDMYKLTDSDLEFLKESYGVQTPADAAEFMEVFNKFWSTFSGAGDGWGDCVGTSCIPGFYIPGFPFGGAPYGSEIHYDRSKSIFSNDLNLLDPLNFHSEFGVDPTEDKRGFSF